MNSRKTVFTFKARLFIALCCLFLLMEGCSTLKDLAESVKKPSLSVTDVHVTNYDFHGMELTFNVTVNNPNALSIQMMSFGYNLDIDGQTLVSGQEDKKSRIEASGKSTFRVPVSFQFKDIYSIAENLAKSDDAAYEFRSTVAFDLPGIGRTEVPVNKKGEIPLLKVPSIRINNLQVDNADLNSASLTLSLEFHNPNGIGLNINNFNYSLDINGNEWAGGNALNGISIAKHDVTKLDIPIKLNIAQMGLSAFKLLSGSSEVDYKLRGNFSIGVANPLLGETNFKLMREGRLSLAK